MTDPAAPMDDGPSPKSHSRKGSAQHRICIPCVLQKSLYVSVVWLEPLLVDRECSDRTTDQRH